MSKDSYEKIIIKDRFGKSEIALIRPWLGDLKMWREGGRTIIEIISFWGNKKTYMPSLGESIEA